jgi:hypothetical protein
MVAESQDVVPAARKRREESGGGGALVASPAGAAVVHRKRRKGVNMPVVRTASGVDIETPVPTLYCAVAMWPFEERYWERVSRTRNMQAWRAIEIFLPATIYPSSPQSFWDMNNEHIDMCNMYKAALSMIFYAAYLSVSPRVRRPEDDDDDVPAELSVNKSVATVERVPARHDSTVFVGFRVRVTEHSRSTRRSRSTTRASVRRRSSAVAVVVVSRTPHRCRRGHTSASIWTSGSASASSTHRST